MKISSLFLTVLMLAVTTDIVKSEFYCGIALSTGHDPHRYYEDITKQVIREMVLKKANFVQISAYAKQVGINSTIIHHQTDEYALKHVFQVAKRNGLGVFFKPVIELESFQRKYMWRGRILGNEIWFKKLYIPYMVSMAKLAEREGVELFSVGSEYRAAVNKTESWIEVIKAVRRVYSGKLTYIGNHDSYWHVKFWEHLDFISISAYFRLVNEFRRTVPGFNETKLLLERKARKLEQWREEANLTNKKVLVAEVGYQSKGGLINYFIPWAWDAVGRLNRGIQARMYVAFFDAFLTKPWSLGAMIWHYELDMNAGNTWAALKYTVQNKPAQWVMRRYFKKYCHMEAEE